MSLTIVQNAISCGDNTLYPYLSGSGNTTVAWGSTPTNGNLLIAMGFVLSGNGVPPAALNGWTIYATNTTGALSTFLAYKYASGASATEVVCESSGGGGYYMWSLAAWEISGSAGTWATDYVASHLSTMNPGNPSFTTANNNELVLGFGGGNDTNSGIHLTFSTGTEDGHYCGVHVDDSGTYDYATGIHYVEPTSGTSIAPSMSGQSGSYDTTYAFVELNSPASGAETAAVTLALSKVSFEVPASRLETASVNLALSKVSFGALASRLETASVTLALSKVALQVYTFDTSSLAQGFTLTPFGS